MITDEMVQTALGAFNGGLVDEPNNTVRGFTTYYKPLTAMRAALSAALAAMPQEPVAWTRDDMAKGLAALDGIVLLDIRSTVGPAQDANSWREYLGRADDLMAHLSLASPAQGATAPAAPSEEDDLRAAREAAARCAEEDGAALQASMLRTGHRDDMPAVQSALIALRTERAKGAA